MQHSGYRREREKWREKWPYLRGTSCLVNMYIDWTRSREVASVGSITATWITKALKNLYPFEKNSFQKMWDIKSQGSHYILLRTLHFVVQKSESHDCSLSEKALHNWPEWTDSWRWVWSCRGSTAAAWASPSCPTACTSCPNRDCSGTEIRIHIDQNQRFTHLSSKALVTAKFRVKIRIPIIHNSQ